VLSPHVVLLTETNVPHGENIAYFGSGDESHMVYQFSLPPLLLDALTHHDAGPLRSWMSGLETPPPGATYFNFTASHDGIGLRPLEGLVPPARVDRLVEAVRLRGGRVGTRRGDDGDDAPYELNISYFDALGDLPAGKSAVTAAHVQRFLASQALMLACRGIPGVYFHSLFGTRNDARAVEATGIARRINRRRFRWEEIEHALRQPASVPARVLAAYRHLLRVRIEQPAFHPDGTQSVLPARRSGTVQFLRVSPDRSQQILVAANVTGQHGEVELPEEGALRVTRDLLGAAYQTHDGWTLPPYAVAWLEVDPGHRR
jgi:sucrose phosphorylase